MLELQDITLRTDGRTICEDLSVDIQKGTCCVITGPNGSGKSQLILCLLGNKKPESGMVLADNRNMHELSAADKKTLFHSTGIVLQEGSLPQHSSVEQILELHEKDSDEREEMLGFLELGEKKNTALEDLSWSEKRRLELGASLMKNPPLFIWDEPFLGLDKLWIQKFLSRLMERRKKGDTLILTAVEETRFDFLNPEIMINL